MGHYMTKEERIILQTLLDEKRPVSYIARKLGCCRQTVYNCHSYSAWEKGSVENHNRMIRRFFPKGTNFDEVTSADVRRVQDWMNSYPRRVLDWKSPDQAA